MFCQTTTKKKNKNENKNVINDSSKQNRIEKKNQKTKQNM